LQVDLLAEKEITKLLQMVRALCGHMGLQNIMADKEIHDLSQDTSIESLSQTLEDRLPGHKVKHVQLKQDVDSAHSGAKSPDLPTSSDKAETTETFDDTKHAS
jgi:D-ribose pyranose/furanose isomerase RbsD